MAAPVIRYYSGDERMDRCEMAIADATEIKPGWLVNYVGGFAVVTDAAGEDAIFAGVAITGHEQNKDYRSTIQVAEVCEIEADVTSADYVRGDGLTLAAAAGGDTISFVDDGGANTVCWAAETKTTATRLRIRIDVWALAKLKGTVFA